MKRSPAVFPGATLKTCGIRCFGRDGAAVVAEQPRTNSTSAFWRLVFRIVKRPLLDTWDQMSLLCCPNRSVPSAASSLPLLQRPQEPSTPSRPCPRLFLMIPCWREMTVKIHRAETAPWAGHNVCEEAGEVEVVNILVDFSFLCNPKEVRFGELKPWEGGNSKL